MNSTQNNFELVLIGASTGGPQALTSILSGLSTNFKCPIVVAQHMPESFLSNFIKQLNRDCVLSVSKANDGDELKAGQVLIAPGDQSLEVVSKRGKLILSYKQCDSQKGFCPSVDTLFESIEKISRTKVLGLILTGIGNDGALGVESLKKNGATIWAQEEKDCAAFGMPKAAVETGIVDRVLSLDDMRFELGGL